MESVTIARPEVRWREGAAARAGWPQVGSYWHARGSRTLAPSPKVPAPMPIRSFRPVLTVLSTLAHVVGCAAMLLACGGSGSSSGSSADSGAPGVELTVPTLEGPVQADVVGGVRRFLKIPYAKPPVGPLRWKAPVKSDPWTAVRHETTFASPCPQSASAQAPQSTDEDCLYLNVWTPERTPANAPVMVWFHGGGNFSGSAADTVPTTKQLWYDGQFFASRHGVVVVTTNYRLGPFGFFAHPALAAEGSRFFFPELALGVFVTGGVTELLPRLVGLQRARELIMLGERFDAAQAHEWGLVWKVVQDEALMREAHALARRIAALPSGPVRDLRRILARRSHAGLEAAMLAETDATVRGFLDPETARRVAAFG